MMTLRQIRHFIAVAETGSISAAAQAVFISQSTLTLAIQQLEEEIGVSLFNRHAKGMSLTHQGHQFLRQAHLILASVDNAKRSLQQSTDQVAGQLTIGVTSLVAGYYLADLITRFQRAYPNVQTRVIEDERRNRASADQRRNRCRRADPLQPGRPPRPADRSPHPLAAPSLAAGPTPATGTGQHQPGGRGQSAADSAQRR
jgi:DNA-binding transcriptional LysR family regulator